MSYIAFWELAYCGEIDILIDQNIAYCCEIDTYIEQNIAYCCEIGMFLTKHTVSLQTSVQREALGTHVNLIDIYIENPYKSNQKKTIPYPWGCVLGAFRRKIAPRSASGGLLDEPVNIFD